MDGSQTSGADEHLQLNETSLWQGSRANRLNPRAREAVPAIRKPLLESQGLDGNKISTAEKLAQVSVGYLADGRRDYRYAMEGGKDRLLGSSLEERGSDPADSTASTGCCRHPHSRRRTAARGKGRHDPPDEGDLLLGHVPMTLYQLQVLPRAAARKWRARQATRTTGDCAAFAVLVQKSL